MLTRRELLEAAARACVAGALLPGACARGPRASGEIWVNDVHSELNRTRVSGVARPEHLDALQSVLWRAQRERRAVSLAGGRHAMGGQQFGSDSLLIDTRGLRGISEFDAVAGQVEVGAGTLWPELVSELLERQGDAAHAWGIVQKQTGADRLSIGGALSANAHGRGLRFAPSVQDVEAFTLADASGRALRCSRREHAELFRLAIGGYGLFGVIASVRLRLAPRRPRKRLRRRASSTRRTGSSCSSSATSTAAKRSAATPTTTSAPAVSSIGAIRTSSRSTSTLTTAGSARASAASPPERR